MSGADPSTIHGSAVLVGDRAVLITGPSGTGKSRLAFDLLLAGKAGQIDPVRLVGDDRLYLTAEGGRLLVRPGRNLEGLIEIRGLGIRRCDHVGEAVVGLLVALAATDAGRMPDSAALQATLLGIKLPRIPVGDGFPALPLVLAALTTTAGFGPLA